MQQGWEHVVGCGGMWQGVGTCGMGSGRVWGHVAGVWICNRGAGLVHRWRDVAGWEHVVRCGDMLQGVGT